MQLPASVRLEENLSYRPGLTLDVYLPHQAAKSEKLPVILNLHAGAFQSGDKSMGMEEVLPLVASGQFAAVSIDYRLSGQAVWPAQLEDCEASLGWIRGQGPNYGLDPKRIGVLGHSAGGHLAAMLGVGGPDGNQGVACVVDISGPADLVQLPLDNPKQDHSSAKSPEGKLLGGAVAARAEKAAQASPINWVKPGCPPFLLIHGDQDPVIPPIQAQRFYRRLKTAGTEVYFVNVRNGGHGNFTNPEVARRIESFFARQLLHREVVVSEEAIQEKD
ncbi:MAG: alpha/beta hydrolase [Candidatus Eremiobacteraeota bacterium]|nr:alpha/beta hydrolase [Candidatus Eremiobacteraeota bacterium]